MKKILSVLFVTAIAATVLFANVPVEIKVPMLLLAGILIQGFVIAPSFTSNHLNMGLDVEMWKKYIITKLLKDNAFLSKSRDDSGMVLGGKVVHIPQAGVDPVVVKNRNVFPAVSVRRIDTDKTYVLESYSTDPTHIPFEELQTISYNKLDSILGRHIVALGDIVSQDILRKWAAGVTGANVLRTTGGAGANTKAGIGGQTGTRKTFDQGDLIAAMTALNVQNVPKKGRLCLMDSNMLDDFYRSLTATQFNAFNQFANNVDGIVGRLHGFDIMERSDVLVYDTTATTVGAVGAVMGATDNYAALCWHPDVVTRAVGEIKPFQQKDSPTMYGDIYSMLVRFGGSQERATGEGVITIVQG